MTTVGKIVSRAYANNIELGWERLIFYLVLTMGLMVVFLLVIFEANWKLTLLTLLLTLIIALLLWWAWLRGSASHVEVRNDGISILFRSGSRRMIGWNEIAKMKIVPGEDPGILLGVIAAYAMREYLDKGKAILFLRDGSRFTLTVEIGEAIQNAHFGALGNWIP